MGNDQAQQLYGLITESDFHTAESEFPGIVGFYAQCPERPHTFLELVARFGAFEIEAAYSVA